MSCDDLFRDGRPNKMLPITPSRWVVQPTECLPGHLPRLTNNALFKLSIFNMNRGHAHQHGQDEGEYQEQHANMEWKVADVKKAMNSTGYRGGDQCEKCPMEKPSGRTGRRIQEKQPLRCVPREEPVRRFAPQVANCLSTRSRSRSASCRHAA